MKATHKQIVDIHKAIGFVVTEEQPQAKKTIMLDRSTGSFITIKNSQWFVGEIIDK